MVAAAHEAHHGVIRAAAPEGAMTQWRAFSSAAALLQQARRGSAGDAIAEAIGLALLALDKVLEGVEHHGGGAHHRGREAGERGLRRNRVAHAINLLI
jgi:hypothetical protein